jgi:hypothetical protein
MSIRRKERRESMRTRAIGVGNFAHELIGVKLVDCVHDLGMHAILIGQPRAHTAPVVTAFKQLAE